MAVHDSLEVLDGGHSPRRSGTAWTCAAHIITAVIGSGVLSLAWSVAQLGWVIGPACMLCFALVTYVSAALLADCYRRGDPAGKGPRNRSYIDAVRGYLGKKHTWACGSLQLVSLYGCGVAYTITTATSIRAILKANCYHKHGHDAPCSYGGSYYMLVFGAAQLLLSFIPDFHDMAWLSVVAAVMSFSYAFISLGLGLATTIANGTIKGSITGVPMRTPVQKIWRVSQAIGDIAFAYPYSLILLEIQDTLKSPPAENKTMKKASMISIFVTTFFYLCCGCFGYARLRERRAGQPPHRLRLLRALLAYRLRQRLHHPPPAGRVPGVQPADLPVRGQVLRGAVPGQRVRERLPHGAGAVPAAVAGEPAAGVLPDAVRGVDDGGGGGVPLLQRGAGAAGRAQLLAAGNLLPRRDVLHPAGRGAVVRALARPPDLQRRLPARQRLRARRIHPGAHHPQAGIG